MKWNESWNEIWNRKKENESVEYYSLGDVVSNNSKPPNHSFMINQIKFNGYNDRIISFNQNINNNNVDRGYVYLFCFFVCLNGNLNYVSIDCNGFKMMNWIWNEF
jgi:hypothetical protein